MEKNDYIKADDNTVVNKNHIRWIKKMNECIEICSSYTGCNTNANSKNTISVCKMNSPDSYKELNKYFD